MIIVILIIPDTCLIQHVFCERMRVYVYLIDGLYRRAELNKHAHCIRVPARARPHQRCLAATCLPALARHYSTEVNSIR
jgi:hypothetical protein